MMLLLLLLLQDPADLIRSAVRDLVSMQEEDGAWPYEGVYRVAREIPAGYRVGGTAQVASALHLAAPDEAKAAVARGLALILRELDDPRLRAGTDDAYDVRVWAHASALEFLCLRKDDAAAPWIPRLARILVEEELPGGGWNYANRRSPASFVTAPVVQALLRARAAGAEVPADVFTRARKSLEAARAGDGAFLYSGIFNRDEGRRTKDGPEGSAARSALCESTLLLLGGGSPDRLQSALDAFHAHWSHLEDRRAKTGTHEGPHAIAPYYFYFGHRYAAQAITLLPESRRAKERDRLLQLLLKTRSTDGTWNDRVFPRSRSYGTAMALLALLGDRTPAAPALK